MDALVDEAALRRLGEYVDRVGGLLTNRSQRASFATYAMGLLGPGERKSIEPIAARATADPQECAALEQRIGHFLSTAEWDDARVRAFAAEYGIAAMLKNGPVRSWIVDDTGFPKQGSHSVGVQRQYSGTLGKTGNCQVAVSLTIANGSAHLPVDFELYLPRTWTDDAKRREEARIPTEVQFETKLELGLRMIRRALDHGLPRGVVLVDTAYGTSNNFRTELRALGLDYAVAVQGPTKVWTIDAQQRIRGEAMSIEDLGRRFANEGAFRQSTWRHGTRKRLSARFAARRVACAYDDPSIEPSQREALWLLIEWPDGDAAPSKFYLSNLPANLSRRQLVQTIKERYRTERAYEDLKGEIGLDHYEGRRWRGWNHHVTVALCCFAFIVAEHERRFPPSAVRTQVDHSVSLAA